MLVEISVGKWREVNCIVFSPCSIFDSKVCVEVTVWKEFIYLSVWNYVHLIFSVLMDASHLW